MQSCFIDGEAIVVDERGLSVFDFLRYRCHDHAAILCAFDLIELDGDDLRPLPIERRKASRSCFNRALQARTGYQKVNRESRPLGSTLLA